MYQQFQELERSHWWFRGMYALCRDELARRVPRPSDPNGRVVLDIGCGTGCWAQGLGRYGRVVALDIADEALAICRGRALQGLVQGSAESLPLAEASCDLVTALGLIEHLDHDEQLLREVARVLKPGGLALLLTSAYRFLWGEHDELVHHKRRYLRHQLRSLVEGAGLEAVRISYVNTVLFAPIALARSLRRLRPRRRLARDGSPDLFPLPRAINAALYALLRMESAWLRWGTLPFGVGLLALARRPAACQATEQAEPHGDRALARL